MRTVPVVVCLFAGFAIQSGLGTADARQRRLASETRVEQARGNMPVGSKTIDGGGPVRGIPEGGPDELHLGSLQVMSASA